MCGQGNLYQIREIFPQQICSVGGENDCSAGSHIRNIVQGFLRILLIQPGQGLVEEEDRGGRDAGSGNRHPSLHAAGEITDGDLRVEILTVEERSQETGGSRSADARGIKQAEIIFCGEV